MYSSIAPPIVDRHNQYILLSTLAFSCSFIVKRVLDTISKHYPADRRRTTQNYATVNIYSDRDLVLV
ncbi:unnamed protein product [Colias eurytheme]|nr:unnamed protein product [Colias eurytheme]